MRAIILAIFMLFVLGQAGAAMDVRCPASKSDERWAAECLKFDGKDRRIKPEYRKGIAFNKFGKAVIVLDNPFEVAAVDRTGKIVIPGIANGGDRDYPNAEKGVGRFYVGKKCGYFKAGEFKILVPAEYDACHPFLNGEAAACKECALYCTEAECHSSTFVGGQGFVFAANGRLLRRYAPPELENACGKTGVDSVGKVHGTLPLLKCKDDPNSPFKM